MQAWSFVAVGTYSSPLAKRLIDTNNPRAKPTIAGNFAHCTLDLAKESSI
jgi:hypothetical protein